MFRPEGILHNNSLSNVRYSLCATFVCDVSLYVCIYIYIIMFIYLFICFRAGMHGHGRMVCASEELLVCCSTAGELIFMKLQQKQQAGRQCPWPSGPALIRAKALGEPERLPCDYPASHP